LLKFHCFGHWNISAFVIVSDFEIRISNFLPKNRGFRSDTNYQGWRGLKEREICTTTLTIVAPTAIIRMDAFGGMIWMSPFGMDDLDGWTCLPLPNVGRRVIRTAVVGDGGKKRQGAGIRSREAG
jgi:hypothetical protein